MCIYVSFKYIYIYLFIYLFIIYQSILSIQGSVGKQREVEADPKVGPAEAASVKLRSDAVSYALLAGKQYKKHCFLRDC